MTPKERAERRAKLERELRAETWVPLPQLSVAYRLAAAHGHHWASAIGSDALGEGRTLAEIEDLSDAHDSGPVAGIRFPVMDDHGQIRHTTGSGRLTWVIGAPHWSGGTASVIEVSRPHVGPVLRARINVDTGGFVAGVHVDDVYPDGHVFGARHVFALQRAMCALMPNDDVASALAPAWALARVHDPEGIVEHEAAIAAEEARAHPAEPDRS